MCRQPFALRWADRCRARPVLDSLSLYICCSGKGVTASAHISRETCLLPLVRSTLGIDDHAHINVLEELKVKNML